MKLPPVQHLHWKRAWRIIPTLYPEEEIYSPIAARGDWPAILELERITNSGIHQELGDYRFLRPGDVLPKGRSAYYIGRPFAFPMVSRFSDGRYGIFYAAKDLPTAVNERAYHAAKFLEETSQEPGTVKERVLIVQIRGSMHDLRKQRGRWKSVYNPNNYSQSQKLGAELWDQGAAGIAYDSVRRPRGECLAVFKPQAISHCRQERCLQYDWDGQKIARVYEIQEYYMVDIPIYKKEAAT
jgi:hypothetical protein